MAKDILADENEISTVSKGMSGNWRVVLTDKRLHVVERALGRNKRKSFDLRNIDSLSIESKVNVAVVGVGAVMALFGFFMLFSEQTLGIGIFVGAIGVLMMIFGRSSAFVVKTANDSAEKSVSGTAKKRLEELVDLAMQQKEKVLGWHASPTPPPAPNFQQAPPEAGSSGRLKELKSMAEQGLISDEEYHAKRKEILERL